RPGDVEDAVGGSDTTGAEEADVDVRYHHVPLLPHVVERRRGEHAGGHADGIAAHVGDRAVDDAQAGLGEHLGRGQVRGITRVGDLDELMRDHVRVARIVEELRDGRNDLTYAHGAVAHGAAEGGGGLGLPGAGRPGA